MIFFSIKWLFIYIIQIKLSLDHVKSENYDDSNALVLPSKKRKTEISLAKEPKKKPLTKKQLKEREKLKEKRTKTARVGDKDFCIFSWTFTYKFYPMSKVIFYKFVMTIILFVITILLCLIIIFIISSKT